ncbi:MAG: M20/M25/M40 family metallo-hydrolase [Armatimonas sp.]
MHPDTKRLLDTFLTLVHFNTPSRSEKSVMDWVKGYLENIGFTVEFDDAGEKLGGNAGNLIAFKLGTVKEAPGVFFSSHLDTVEATPGLEVEIDGDVISAKSDTILGADDKCGVAPILEAMTLLHESGEAHGDVQLLLTICEEIGLQGAKQLDPSRIKAKFGFVLDAGPPVGNLTCASPGQNSLKVSITGKPAHAGVAPELGISAIQAAANAISKMTLGRIDSETTANIGIIQGGTGRNIVPAEVTLIGEARSRDAEKLARQTAHMVETFEREAAALGAKADVAVTSEYASYRLSESDTVVQMAAAAAKAVGLPVELKESGGGSDANIFNGHGVPTVVLATGMEEIHTHKEFCRLSDMEKDTRWVLEIVRQAARV